jgi:hypothetical protein
MTQRLALLILLLALPMLACTLSESDDNDVISPTTAPILGPAQLTATALVSQNGDVPGISTATPTTTPTRQAVSNNPTSSSGSNPQPSGPPAFSNLSFSTTAAGANMTAFPFGTKEVFVRWNYTNVPIGTTMSRQWYRDGVQVASREEAWSRNWGITGRLTHINYFDTQSGLPSGSYYVVIRLPSYGTEITGTFTISGAAPTFSNISFSRQSNGAATTSFPYGTQEVYVRWQFANVPTGAIMRREWYRNGALFINRDEAWNSTWGSSGTLTHIRTYEFDTDGLGSGDYRVVIYLRDFPSVRVEGTFRIENNTPTTPSFSNLTFSPTASGANQSEFPTNTKLVFARWNYANVPNGSQLQVQWSLNGVVQFTRPQTWNTPATSGTFTDTPFDNTANIAPGAWQVRVELVGYANTVLTATFNVAASPITPSIGTLGVSATPGGTISTAFPYNVGAVYAAFDYANVSPATEIRAVLESSDGGSFKIELVGTWVYTNSGRALDLWIGSPDTPLPAGRYRLTLRLSASGASVTTEFTVNPPDAPVVDPNIPYYIPPQLDPKAVPPVTPVGAWVRLGP